MTRWRNWDLPLLFFELIKAMQSGWVGIFCHQYSSTITFWQIWTSVQRNPKGQLQMVTSILFTFISTPACWWFVLTTWLKSISWLEIQSCVSQGCQKVRAKGHPRKPDWSSWSSSPRGTAARLDLSLCVGGEHFPHVTTTSGQHDLCPIGNDCWKVFQWLVMLCEDSKCVIRSRTKV